MRMTLASMMLSTGLLAACQTPQPSAEPSVDPTRNLFAGLDFAKPSEDEARPQIFADPTFDRLRSNTLMRFSSEAEFLSWQDGVRKAAEARGVGWWGQPVPALAAPPPPPPPPGSAPADAASIAQESIVVTASVAPAADASNPEITNNQIGGVDEGGIVKQIGQHLVVLLDGRLFVTDLTPGGEPGLKLSDRANVYRSSDEDTWYDEMLVSGRTILVTGYSYAQNASEFTVLTLSPEGKVTREATFYISSSDYYDTDNYATRMIDGKLVIHTPVFLAGQGWWDAFDPPVIREWRAEGGQGTRDDPELSEGVPLFKAEDIWMPVQRLAEPVIHTVTVCDIAGATDAKAPACKATAMVGSEDYTFLVTQDAFWLWMAPSEAERQFDTDAIDDAMMERMEGVCLGETRPADADLVPAVLARLPIDGSSPSVLGVKGTPQNQFSLDKDEREFRALLDWRDARCPPWGDPEKAQLAYFNTPLSALSTTLRDAADSRFTAVPALDTPYYEARFTASHLAYGGRSGWGGYPPDRDDPGAKDEGRVTLIPLDAPNRPKTLALAHGVIRAERAGPYLALTGYRDGRGLSVSMVDLRAQPKVAGSLTLIDRYESENRSHAFNARIDAEGAGLIGLPTVRNEDDSGRYWFWSDSSDLSYLSVSPQGTLSLAGTLAPRPVDPDIGEPGNADYECEVSCIDWYGNARPIFTFGRVFALANTEIIEGVEQGNGRITEVRRLDLTAAPDTK